jgi:hypothetical protein
MNVMNVGNVMNDSENMMNDSENMVNDSENMVNDSENSMKIGRKSTYIFMSVLEAHLYSCPFWRYSI